MASNARFLIGPELLLQICHKQAGALAWSDRTAPHHCFISSLAFAMLQSIIDRDGADEAARDEWHRALDHFKGGFIVDGGSIVEPTSEIVAKWRYWRERQPLEFFDGRQRHPVDQDIRLLLATADALGLTYAEFDAPYLHQAASRGLAVEVVART